MMKKTINTILVSALAVAGMVSCDLNLTPTTSIAYEEGGVLLTNSTDVTSFRNGMYASFRGLQRGEYQVTEEYMLDGFNAHMDYGNNYGGVHRTNDDFNSGDYYTRDYWSSNYGAIKNYNIVISNADNAAEDVLESARAIKGEAFFFRAYSYLRLARHFGKAYNASSAASDLCVPLVLVYDQNEKPARATVKDVYASIKSDLDSAAAIVTAAGAVRSEYLTVDAVQALFARYYMDVADYSNAVAAAQKVIGSAAGYKLASTQAEMTKQFVTDDGDESIMQLYCTQAELPAQIPYFNYVGATGDVPEGYYMQPYFLPTKTLIALYSESDLRNDWYGNAISVKGTVKNLPIKTGANYNYDIKAFLKYAGNPGLSSTNIQSGYNAVKPFCLSEMYLIAAECSFRAGNTDAAKAYLNTLQTARHAESTEATLSDIQNEWRKETVGEGLRMSCMKRWGIGYSGRIPQDAAVAATAVLQGTYYDEKVFPADDYHFQWPVPSYELKINKNLVQNDGYADI